MIDIELIRKVVDKKLNMSDFTALILISGKVLDWEDLTDTDCITRLITLA